MTIFDPAVKSVNDRTNEHNPGRGPEPSGPITESEPELALAASGSPPPPPPPGDPRDLTELRARALESFAIATALADRLTDLPLDAIDERIQVLAVMCESATQRTFEELEAVMGAEEG